MSVVSLLSLSLVLSFASAGVADSLVTSSSGSLSLHALQEALPADGQSSTGLVIRVLDPQGQPLAHAEVKLETSLGALMPTSVTTNKLGFAAAGLRSSTRVGEAVVTAKWKDLQASIPVLFHSGRSLLLLGGPPELKIVWTPDQGQPGQPACAGDGLHNLGHTVTCDGLQLPSWRCQPGAWF